MGLGPEPTKGVLSPAGNLSLFLSQELSGVGKGEGRVQCSQLWRATAGYTPQDVRSHALCQGPAVGEGREGPGPGSCQGGPAQRLMRLGTGHDGKGRPGKHSAGPTAPGLLREATGT